MSRIDMIMPRTTTPATTKTALSSLSLACGAGDWVRSDVTLTTLGVAADSAQFLLWDLSDLGSGPGELLLDRRDDALVLGLDLRGEPGDDLAVGRHEELLEVPLDVAVGALLVGRPRQGVVDLVPALAVDLDLLRERERDAVRRRAELGDLLG